MHTNKETQVAIKLLCKNIKKHEEVIVYLEELKKLLKITPN